MFHLKHLSVSIEGKKILTDISLSFEDGKTYALLGKNGSGKSTLAGAIAGRPDIEVATGSEMFQDTVSLLPLSPDKRSKLGVFVSLQSPPALPGVSIFSLLRYALPGRDPVETRKKIAEYANSLSIDPKLLHRGLFDGFSGGEKRKFEALLWAILAPKFSLFDELDTGLDVDAQKIIANFLKTYRTPGQTFVFITHSTAFLDTLAPDTTFVLDDGKIVRTGDGSLAQRIIKTEGFEEK